MLDNDRDNYKLWYKAVTLVLQNCGLWHIVNGMDIAPDKMTNPDAYKVWCLKDQEAQLTILLALKKSAKSASIRPKHLRNAGIVLPPNTLVVAIGGLCLCSSRYT
jgi:hypothetical protein